MVLAISTAVVARKLPRLTTAREAGMQYNLTADNLTAEQEM